MKVMIVDDAKFMQISIQKILEQNGIEVVGTANNGIEAIKKYNELRPDVVTMDITMPDMDGIHAVKGIMQIDPNAKIIMCSAMGQEGMVKEAIIAGAKDYIVKPLNSERLVNAVKNVCK